LTNYWFSIAVRYRSAAVIAKISPALLLPVFLFLTFAVRHHTVSGRALSNAEMWSTFGGQKWDNDKCADWRPCYDAGITCDFYSMYHGNCHLFDREQTQPGNSDTCVEHIAGEFYCGPHPANQSQHVCLAKRKCKDAVIIDPITQESEFVCLDDVNASWVDVAMAYDQLLADDCP
jgi:hypothetical protein